MQKTHKSIIAAVSLLLVSIMLISIVLGCFLLNQKVYAVNFSEGDYDAWDGITYTFDWYENPTTNEDGNVVYTISSASDLAALSILTNDLSKDEFNYITDKLTDENKHYAKETDLFENCIINVECDIDLANHDWFPISYPWTTANLSSNYDIVTPDGTTVKYVALSDVPELELVDNNISTRYWEFPESELRFRDLTQIVSPCTWLNGVTVSLQVLEYCYTSGLPTYNGDNDVTAITTGEIHLSMPTVDIPAVELHMTDYTEDAVISYGYKDITGYTETTGFMGRLNFNNHKLKGLTPSTEWTDDATERVTTYDPMGKALVGMLGEDGELLNLDLKGEYDDVVSYSAFAVAYNYGTIDNVYVQGHMRQQLITQYYPVNRDYSPNHDSEYIMSDNAGTVLPVGHCGYISAVNNGTISNCLTEGEVTQAFRSFGFIADTNNGTIINCTNNADISSTEVQTDFYTDEWSWNDSNHQVEMNDITFKYWDTDTFTDSLVDINGYYDSNTVTQEQISLWRVYGVGADTTSTGLRDLSELFQYISSMASTHLSGNAHVMGHGSKLPQWAWEVILGRNSFMNSPESFYAYDDSSDPDANVVWIPELYNTDIGESIAANHLYGVYSYTSVGGICSINNGTISDSVNTGCISTIGNTSPRTAWTAVDSTKETNRDSYSYIRPTNQYAFLCTQSSVANLAAGICVTNTGTVTNCSNNATIITRNLSTSEKTSYEVNDIDFIPWTQNGYYQNDCIVLGTTSKEIYPGGYRWWITEDNYEQYATYQIKEYRVSTNTVDPITGAAHVTLATLTGNFPNFDRNMPYPFVKPLSGNGSDYIQQITGSISVYNYGNITDSLADGKANCGITGRSFSLTGAALFISDCNAKGEFDLTNIAGFTDDTSIVDCTTEAEGAAPYAFARTALGTHSRIELNNLIDYTSSGGFNTISNADITNIRLYNTNSNGLGLADVTSNSAISNVNNYQKSQYGLSSLYNCEVEDCEIYGITDFAIGSKLEDSSVDYYNVYNSISNSVFGNTENTVISNSEFYSFDTQGVISTASNIGTFNTTNLEDVTIFTNVSDYIMFVDECNISDVLVYGNTATNDNYDYLMNFSNTTAENMLIEMYVDYTYADPFTTGVITDIPGILKAYVDTNNFTNCVIQTTDGIISYNTDTLFLDYPDSSILSDATLVYDENARASGALAFYADHGNNEDRTYNYTVATTDTVELCPEVEMGYTADYISLPAYTRHIKDTDEKSFYQIAIPLTGRGVGEVIGTINGYSTSASAEQFPKISIYGNEGDTVSLTIDAVDNYALKSLTEASSSGNTILPSEDLEGSPYKLSAYTIKDYSVQLLAEWDDTYSISIDKTLDARLKLTPSCTGAVYGERIFITPYSLDASISITGLCYYCVLTDSAGASYIDYDNPIAIDLDTYSFLMPSCDVVVSATVKTSQCDILTFKLAGTTGIIDNTAITIGLDNSVDLTSVAPDLIRISPDATIEPSTDTLLDFTQPVTYTVTAADGQQKQYTVTVIPTEDGKISEFMIVGKRADINQDTMTISVTLSQDIDLTDVTPYIVWSGTNLVSNPDSITDGTTYTVTDSQGMEHCYTLRLTLTDQATFSDIELSCEQTALQLVLNESNKTILAYYPYGTDVTDVTVTALDWYGRQSSLAVGDKINLTKVTNFIILDDAGVAHAYFIVGVETQSSACDIYQFNLYGVNGKIEGTNITVTLPSKYDITNIRPDVIGFVGYSVSDITEYHDFSSPVNYTVTAYTGDTKTYTVSVIQSD